MTQAAGSDKAASASTGSTERITRAGVMLTIRVASAADIPLIADIYGHLTAQDMRFRFKGQVDQLGAEELRTLVDPGAGMTSYLALSGDVPVACATLMRDPGRGSAELILSVRPEWKGHGISWTLLEDVVARAAAAGLTRITSHEFSEDHEAVNLQREMGFVARLHSADPPELSLVKALDS